MVTVEFCHPCSGSDPHIAAVVRCKRIDSICRNPEIIFSVPAEARFAAALNLLGINPAMLSGEAGHA